MDQCLEYERSITRLRFWPLFVICILIDILIVMIAFSINVEWLNSTGFDLCFLVLLLPFILADSIISDKNSGEDNINYGYVLDFLFFNNLKHYDHFGSSFCVDDGSVFDSNNKRTELLDFIFIICAAIYVFIDFYLYSKYPNAEDTNTILLISLVMGTGCIYHFTHNVIDYVISRHYCTEKVTSVAVSYKEKLKEIRNEDEEGRKELVAARKLFFYIRYNGKRYILFKEIWEVTSLPIGYFFPLYINPKNPMEYCYTPDLTEIGKSLIFLVLSILVLTFYC